jgi:hypothetical protein
MFPKGSTQIPAPQLERKQTMRRTLLALAVSMVMAAFTGCMSNCCNQCGGLHLRPGAGYAAGQGDCPNGGQNCGLRGHCLPGCGLLGGQGGPGGGDLQAGQGAVVSYPYYTTRGPRDFLETHPQSIGP